MEKMHLRYIKIQQLRTNIYVYMSKWRALADVSRTSRPLNS